MIRLHEREELTRLARIDFCRTFADFTLRHKLTYVELAQLFAEQASSSLKFALRVERHGNDEKPAGEA